MDRKQLINRLVNRCLTSEGKGKAGCVPCFARSDRFVRKICMVGLQRSGQAASK